MRNCCVHKKSSKKCIRSKDDKTFSLPRRFSRKKCISSKVKGFSMKSSCAPYKYCKQSGSSRKTKRKKNNFYTTQTTLKKVLMSI